MKRLNGLISASGLLFIFSPFFSCSDKTVTPGPSPSITSFVALPTAITSGQTTTLSWTVNNASTISLDNGIGVVTGTDITINPASTTTYTLKAISSIGVDSATVTVSVSLDPNTVVVTVNPASTINPNAKKLLGITFDARSSFDYGAGKVVGYHDASTGNLLPAFQSMFDRIPFTTLRYPGNAVMFDWNWKYSIGPLVNRTAQILVPGVSNTIAFGFDEFMKMVEARGLSTSEVQIMVNIYPIAGEVSVAQSAADWVEYCNSPNDGTNPGLGTDWAAVRAANGHSAPYNVRIWNIGNEPWGSVEFNFDETQYIPLAVPIIDAMKLVDPTVQITLPFVGKSNSSWNTGLLNSASLAGKFWGISPHYFYDEEPGTNNPNIVQDEGGLKAFETMTKSKGLGLIIGDHSHDAPAGDTDKGFRWQGALASLDFLIMASQISNIDRANYWTYGNTVGAWHPIRKNIDGTYTFMAAAQVYELLFTMMLDKSVTATLTTVSAGNAVNIRPSAFLSNDGLKATIAVVNIDINNSKTVALPVLTGYSMTLTTLITGNLTDDTFTKTTATLQGDGTFLLPKAGALFIEYVKN